MQLCFGQIRPRSLTNQCLMPWKNLHTISRWTHKWVTEFFPYKGFTNICPLDIHFKTILGKIYEKMKKWTIFLTAFSIPHKKFPKMDD